MKGRDCIISLINHVYFFILLIVLSLSYTVPLFKQCFPPRLPLVQALTWAARQGHKNVVLKLLELGANKMLQTKHGNTPSEIAKRNKHLEVFFYILN